MNLPLPPSDEEKSAYRSRNLALLYGFGIASTSALLGGLALFAIQDAILYPFAAFFVVMSAYLGLGYALGLFARGFDYEKHKWLAGPHVQWERPASVDVFIATCGEDLAVIANTVRHAVGIEWSFPASKKIYLLDDSGRPEVQAIAEKFGCEYFARPDRGVLKKAGNLRYAFARTAGEFIVVFDADFTARRDFLQNLMPYFRDPKVAIVQSPQFFTIRKGQTWVEKGAVYVQELFYRVVQMNRDQYNGAICVGTNAVYRREALEPFGGTAPIGYSEDMHTGWMLIRAGWHIRYVPVNLAQGLCPDTPSAFFVQQYRWCMGSTTLFLNPEFWTTKLRPGLRLSYLSGMLYYWATGLSVFLNPVPSMIMIWLFPGKIHWHNYAYALPSFLFSTGVMAIWSRAPYGFYVPRVRLLSYWAHIFALRDKLVGSAIPWVSTGSKEAKTSVRYDQFRTAHAIWTFLQIAVVTGGVVYNWSMFRVWDLVPLLFLTAFNAAINLSLLH